MNTLEKYIGLLHTAYDLSSIGIGVQRNFLEKLIQGPVLDKEGGQRGDSASNLLASPEVLDILRPNVYVTSGIPFTDARKDSIRQKHSLLCQQEKRICSIVLRSVIHGQLTEDDSELQDNEYQALLLSILENSEILQKPARIEKPLTEEKSLLGVLIGLYRAKIFPTEEYESRLFSYKSDERLRRRHIKYHTDKLDLMVEIMDATLEAAQSEGDGIPSDYRPDTLDSKWAQNWRRVLGEEFPTLPELIQKAKESVQAARSFLEVCN